MTAGRPPRVRGLLLALVVVLVVMGYAFWRAAAGPRADGAPKAGEAAEESAPAASATAPSSAGRDAARPSAASLTPSGQGGGAGHASAASPPPAAQPPARRPGETAAAAMPSHGEMDEGQLMARLRAIKDSDPASAVTLAREGNRRFSDSADAPERTSILIHALVATDKGSEARGEAEQMVNHYPDSTWVREVERFTGAHRHRNVHVNDAGQLIFQ